jgi:hypothetical protein
MNHGFSSGLFISWAHDQREWEAEHRFLKEVVHVDFVTGITRSKVIYGTTFGLFEASRALSELAESGVDSVSYRPQSRQIYDL